MRKDPLDLSGVLIFPNKRELAMSSLGFLKVHGMLARRVAVADISYLPGSASSPVVSRRKGILLGEETGREVSAFDLVGFSVSYENDYVNVVRLLDLARIEPFREKRVRAFPLVLMGGFTVFMNPRPLAPFADAMVVGEAEPVLDEVLERVAAAKTGSRPREALLESLSRVKGVLVPAAGAAGAERVFAGPESFAPEPDHLPGGGRSHFGEMRLVEVGRGCGRGCLFCAAGCLYRPVRMRGAGEILKMAEGARRVGLVGPAVADHVHFESIIAELVERGVEVGVSSLRADRITGRLAGLLARGGMRTATVAPEAGTERLRRDIGKALTDEEIVEAVRLLAEAGIPGIKLYFMFGLPGETGEDIGAIVRLVRRLSSVRGKARLSVSAAPFIPKPGTPFEHMPFGDMRELKRRAALIGRIREIKGCSLKVASIENARVEAFLAAADESAAPLLVEAARSGSSLKTLLRRASR